MGGLVAAAQGRALGAGTLLLEKGDRPGGSMLLSSCVIWRYRSLERFRAECPGGDPALQNLVIERLDEGLAWLESLGAPVVARATANPRTVGMRFEPHGLMRALVEAGGEPLLRTPLEGEPAPLVLATGGFGGDSELVRRFVTPFAERLWLRANPWSTGDALRYATARGAALTGGLDEFYGRNLPAPPATLGESAFVELSQLYGRLALVVDEGGEPFAPEPPSWSEIELVTATARRPGARAWYCVDGRGLEARVGGRSVAGMVEAAERAGGTVHRATSVAGLARAVGVGSLPRSPKLALPPFTAVHVAPGITHTIGGLRVDAQARVLTGHGEPVPGLLACGADVGGISTGGYSSGLAAALVLGRIAAETALA